jgi:hypothetical protein
METWTTDTRHSWNLASQLSFRIEPLQTRTKNCPFVAVSAHLLALLTEKGPISAVFVYWLVHGVLQLTYLVASICRHVAAGETADFMGGGVG